MRYFITASLLCFSLSHLYGANPTQIQPPPLPEEEKQEEVAGPENAFDYNLYDRMQNRQEQEQRQQYFYYQNQQNQQQQQQNAPQYTRKRQTMQNNQYFDPRNE